MSELISGAFEVDSLYFCPAIDRDAFIDDMNQANIQNARYCSPLLVNALCGYRCVSILGFLYRRTEADAACQFWSPRARTLGYLRGHDIVEKVVQESKKMLDIEGGRATISTPIALYYIFMTVTYQGRDRAALMYRYMIVDVLKRLNLMKRFSRLKADDLDDQRERTVISKAIWGLFHIES